MHDALKACFVFAAFPSTIFNDAKEEDQILFSIFILILKVKEDI